MPAKLNRVRKFKWLKRMRTHGFRARMLTRTGRAVLARRRAKGKHSLTVQLQK